MNTMQILSLWVIFFIQNLMTYQCEKIDEPTLKPADKFSASVDAGVFKAELDKVRTTDRDKLVDIWFHRTYEQRMQITDFYNTNLCPVNRYGRYYIGTMCPLRYGIEVIADDNTSDLYKASQISNEGILANTIYDAITDKLKEVGAIEEVVCANDPEMKGRIEEYYKLTFKEPVAKQLETFRKDDKDYQHVMQQYCWKGLCQDKKIKPEDVEKEAKALRDIHPDKDKEGFKKKLIELFENNCEPDLKLIFEKYRNKKDGISDAVDKAFDVKRVRRAYNRLVRYVENTCQFYADELHAAVDGLGTKSDKINRIILTRCERDLACILRKYKDTYDKTFTNRLKTDTIEQRYLKSIRFLCGKT